MRTLIGISGGSASGKSFAADTLTAEFRLTQIGFADELKRIAMRLWPLWTEETLWGPSRLRNVAWPEYGGLTPRRALQFLGTEVGRELDPDVWVRLVRRTRASLMAGGYEYHRTVGLRYEYGAPPVNGIVLFDTRFLNEMAYIHEEGGQVWLIERPGSGLTGEAGAHSSENALDGATFDTTIVNGASLAEFREKVAREAYRAGVTGGGGT